MGYSIPFSPGALSLGDFPARLEFPDSKYALLSTRVNQRILPQKSGTFNPFGYRNDFPHFPSAPIPQNDGFVSASRQKKILLDRVTEVSDDGNMRVKRGDCFALHEVPDPNFAILASRRQKKCFTALGISRFSIPSNVLAFS